MARIKYYDSSSGEWKYGDTVGNSAQNIKYDSDMSYSDGTVGKELNIHSLQINQKANKTDLIPLNTTMASTHTLSTVEEQFVSDNVVKKSNRNLFDNPWFTVNQRGFTANGSLAGYTVDRWTCVGNDAIVVYLSENGLSIQSLIEYEHFKQYFEDIESLLGKQLTLSIKYSNGNISYKTFTMPSQREEGWVNIPIDDTVGLRYTTRTSSAPGVGVYTINSSIVVIKAIKLEFGSVSTLVNDSAPDYATELAKCRMYYQRYWAWGHPIFVGGTLTEKRFMAELPAMAHKPVVSNTNATKIVANGTIYAASSITVDNDSRYGAYQYILLMTTSGNLPANTAAYMTVENGYIELSCDL